MAHRVAPQAEADLDDIWLFIARESGSIPAATRLIDAITSMARAGFLKINNRRMGEADRRGHLWA